MYQNDLTILLDPRIACQGPPQGPNHRNQHERQNARFVKIRKMIEHFVLFGLF